MMWARRFWLKLQSLFRRNRSAQRLDDEIQFHLEQQIAENLARGMSPQEARYAAIRAFGNRTLLKEETRDSWGWIWLERIAQDLRHATRMLRNSRGFAAIAVLTLALGIGANAAIFSVLDRDLLRPLPYRDADRLVFFGMLIPSFDSRPFLFTSSYLQLGGGGSVPFESIASWRPGVAGCDLTEEHPSRLACVRAQSTFLATFGVTPILGSDFSAEEEGTNAPQVCLISHALWKSRFGGSAAALGQTLSLDGQATRVIGVLSQNFEWPTLARVDVILPEAISAAEKTNPTAGVVRAYGRLKPGVTLAMARAQLAPAVENWREASPPMFRKEMRLGMVSVREDQVGSIQLALLVLFGASLAFLVLAAANVACLFLARGAAREHELAVRAALGASRGRLVILQLTESTLLGSFGGLVGAAIAFGLLRFFVALAPAGIPRIAQAGFDRPVFLFVLGASLFTGLICGLAPVFGQPVRTLLAGPSLGPRRARIGTGLVAAQVAVSIVLVIGAGLFLDTLRNIENIPLGMDTTNLVSAEITLRQSFDEPRASAEFFDRLDRRLRNLPGVTGVAVSDSVPPAGPQRAHQFFDTRVEGRPPFPQGTGGLVGWRIVTPGYFQMLGIPILEGRGFVPIDQDQHMASIVVSKKLAERLFPRQSAVGHHLQLSVPSGPWYTVVGVAGDVTYLGESGRVGRVDPEYYVARKNLSALPTTPEDVDRHAFFLVRSPMKSAAVERLVRGEIASLDPTLPAEISTLSARINLLRVEPRFNAALISLFAGMGFLLAMIGLYGVLAFLVSSRTREIGVRMALGAKPESVLTMVVWHGVRLMLVGFVAGAGIAFTVAHFLQGLLYGVSPLNPAVASTSALLLLIVGLAACYIPARRAMRVDPMVALRYE